MLEEEPLLYASARGRWVLLATVLGSAMASLDATVVNIALPAIQRDFGGGLSGLQWTVTSYSLTLAALLLLGGTLGDRFGRRRVFVIGVAWFALASVACGLAPSVGLLVAARALQGVGGALLTPGSLAILQSSFHPKDRAAAIGAWSGLGGVATALGPFVGGYLIQAVSWRLVFFINVPLALGVIWIARRFVPDSRDEGAAKTVDVAGGLLAVLGLGGITYALIDGPELGFGSLHVLSVGGIGVLGLAAFVIKEWKSDSPMLDVTLFRSRQFTAANAQTLIVYAALSGAFFLVPIELQSGLGYSPLGAGMAVLPITAMMLLLSSRMGALSQRIGPRALMTVGPIVAACGLWVFGRIGGGGSYLETVFPAAIIFGLGLAITVAPLTVTVLAAAPAKKAGIASAINNCVARTAGLIAVAALPLAAGMTGGGADLHAGAFSAGFHRGVDLAAILCVLGGLVALFWIRTPTAYLAEHAVDTTLECPLDAPHLRGPE